MGESLFSLLLSDVNGSHDASLEIHATKNIKKREKVFKRRNKQSQDMLRYSQVECEKKQQAHTEAPMLTLRVCVCVCVCILYKHTQAKCSTSYKNSERLHLVCGWDNMSRQSSLTSCELSWSSKLRTGSEEEEEGGRWCRNTHTHTQTHTQNSASFSLSLSHANKSVNTVIFHQIQ